MVNIFDQQRDNKLTGYPSGAGAEEGPFVSFTRKNPNFLISSFAINAFALSDGWYSSQNTYTLLSLHNVDAGTHVRAGRILPNEQHGESEFLNPAIYITNRLNSEKNNTQFNQPKLGDAFAR